MAENSIVKNEIEKRIMEAEQYFSKQKLDEAFNVLSQIISNSPEYIPAYRKIAALYLRTKNPEEALPFIKKALALSENDAESWNIMGHYYVRFRLWDKALEAFRKSLELTGDNAQTEYEIVKIYRSMGDSERLFAALEKLTEKYPDNLVFGYELAKELFSKAEYRKALEAYEYLMQEHPIENLPAALIGNWQELMNRFGRNAEVLAWLEQQNRQYPNSSVVKWLLAVSYIEISEYKKAQELLLKAHAIDSTNADFLYTLAYTYYSMGQKKEALHYYMKSLQLKPLQPSALRVASSLHSFQYGDQLFTYLNQATAYIADLKTQERADVYNALGQAFESVGELETAFVHYAKGGEYHTKGKSNDLKKLYLLNTLVQKVDRTFFETNSGNGCHTQKPVFILGMIRSGTTLTETILSSLPGVSGAGELRYLEESLDGLAIGNIHITSDTSSLHDKNADFRKRGAYYLEKLEERAPKESRRIVDKMPDNFKYAGVIPLILPEASIIHMRRHPVETCLSAYKILFAMGHYWSDDLRTMGQYYRMYHNMMAHWKEVLPENTMLEVKYEDLVNEPERESKRMAAHIGIEWVPECMEFHKGNKPVHTASAMQVTQPIYKTSTNRWRKYEPYLKPLLDEIGDLVEAYEAELADTQ